MKIHAYQAFLTREAVTHNVMALRMNSNIIFIDSRVTDYSSLIAGLAEPAEVFILDAASDGLDQILAQLYGRADISALHLLSHGSKGTVNLTDAIGVLKHVVSLTSPDPVWYFVIESNQSIPTKANLTPGTPQTTLSADLSGTSPVHVGLVGYLTGDVDGSYAAGLGAQDLDLAQPSYFTNLVAGYPVLSLAQFGVYG